MKKKRQEREKGEGAFSQVLGCLDVKDAFPQVPQEKPLKVNPGGEEIFVNEMYLDKELEQKQGLTVSTEYLAEELNNYKFSAECPCLGKK